MLTNRPVHPLRIGEHVLDPGLNELRRGEATQRLPARLADLLLRLAQEPGRMVPRDTLIDEVWERRQVNDEVLSRAIADLRQFLGDDARAPRYIETLPKLGYRLVAEVRPEEVGDYTASPESAAPSIEPTPAATTPETPTTSNRFTPLRAATAALIAAAGLIYLSRDDAPVSPSSPPAVAPFDPLTAANLLRARPFTTEAGRELFPRFTPDARWVIYTRAGAENEPAVLRLRAVDGTEDRALVEDGVDNYCGTVSPDGSTLAWLRARPGVCELVYRALLGGPARVLAGCTPSVLASCPDWAPDGRALVLAGNAEHTGLVEVSFPQGELRPLTTPSRGTHDLMPRYAPDGDLVFWRGDGWGRNLLRFDRDNGIERVLRAGGHLAFGHAFVGDEVLLADDSFGQRALVRFAPAATEPSVLLGGTDARYPDVGRDGALVYEVARYDANLWRIDLRDATAAPQRLTQSARYDSQPSYSLDGQWLAFGSNRDGREGVYLMRPDGSEERKLPLDPALRWTSPVWTSDGTSLIVLRYDGDRSQFCTHELATSQTRCRPELGFNRHGAFLLDADTLAMIDAESETPTLWRAALATGKVTEVGVGEVDRCAATTRWLACHRPGTPGLWLQNRADGTTRPLLPELGEERGAWALSDSAIYFALRAGRPNVAAAGSGERRSNAEGREPGVYRLDLNRGEQTFVNALLPSAIGATIAVAPDESALVLARTDGLETDLMLVPPPER